MWPWINPVPMFFILFVIIIWSAWHSESQQRPEFVINIIHPISITLIYIVSYLGSHMAGSLFWDGRNDQYEGYKTKKQMPDEVRSAIHFAFYVRGAYKSQMRFDRHVNSFIRRVSPHKVDLKVSRTWYDFVCLVLPIWVIINIILLVKPSYELSKLHDADMELMDATEKLSKLGISLYILLQICIAVITLYFAQIDGWETGVDFGVHYVRGDIRRVEKSGTDASNDRLQWWIDGIVGDHPEWLEDGYLLDGEPGKEGKLEV